MAILQKVFKDEIERIARKEIRAHTDALNQVNARTRVQIAALKRRVAELERALKQTQKAAGKVAQREGAAPSDSAVKHRFSAKRFAGHRQRLNLSQAEMGLLLGVSDQSVRQWERDKGRPRNAHLPAIAALGRLTPHDAAEVVKERFVALKENRLARPYPKPDVEGCEAPRGA